MKRVARIFVMLSAFVFPAHAQETAPERVSVSTPQPLVLSGRLAGYTGRDYVFALKAGQTLVAQLTAKNPQTYFNLTKLGEGEAVFVGSIQGNTATFQVPEAADYVVHVYLMRAAARRGAQADFTLTLGVASE